MLKIAQIKEECLAADVREKEEVQEIFSISLQVVSQK